LSALLWSDALAPMLVVVNSAGFLAEFSIQFHEHTSMFFILWPFGADFWLCQVIESHSETAPSLRIDKAFPALLEYATSLDFSSMDPTDHTHVPYVIILVRALDDWRKTVCTSAI
jgi:amyloid beta precursor protein binding protein 1